MNAAELIKTLANKTRLSQAEVGKRLDALTAIVTDELLNERSVSLTDFGVLETSKRDEKIGINPTTGKKILVPPRIVIKFRPSKSLKERLKTLPL
ncbi:MAG: HU family DNA-binding protein [Candidatus Symbiothrix sp.]|jgi:nucleoid DNA-binding protein|nr:HU family DNA-binding protein [Candidatus Symbiothrix sp.]